MESKGARHPFDKGDGRFFSNIKIKDAGYFAKYSHEEGADETRLVIQVQPGGGNPLHYHNSFTETFECNKGTLSVEVGDNGEIKHLKPGEQATIPMATSHRFFNETKEVVEFTGTVRPGNRGLEQSIFIVYGLANDGLTDDESKPTNFLHLSVFVKLGDIHLCGMAGYVLNPMMSAAYAYAKWSGVERSLIDKYCPEQLRG